MIPFDDVITRKALGIFLNVGDFWKTYRFLKRSQWWERDRLKEYQLQRLTELLNRAYENVPYYRRVLDKRGLKPKDIRDFRDLQKIPFLTKEDIHKNLDALKAGNYPQRKLEYVTTGGTTGMPLGIYYEKGVSRAIEQAFIKTLEDRVGYSFRDKCVILRGYFVESAHMGKFWKKAFFGRWLILSSYHMTDQNLPKYIETIREFKPKFIQAYPSAIVVLARFMRKYDVKPFPTVKAILCSSENLYPYQRKLLEEVFRCRVFSWYGHTEMAVLAGECEKSSYYHIFPEYGFVELVNNSGNQITNEGEIGEIVATGLNNFVFPLIRYRTGDLAVLSNETCECGREYLLLKRIEGREQEFIIGEDGNPIPLGPVIFGIHDVEWIKVRRFQFLQEKPGELILQVVKDSSFSETEVEKYLLKLFKARLEGRCVIKVRFVDYIPLTQSGKYKFLIQKLPVRF